jgi:hypothetical protein
MVLSPPPSLVSLTTLAFCGVALLNTALAAPPTRSSGGHGLLAPGTASAAPVSIAHLDLRLPVDALDDTAKYATQFPSALHRPTLAALQQSGGGSDAATNARTPGRLEELARRVRREGLPIARLWQNKSALVSLGLNQRGKPGLWLIQKVH